VIARGLPDEATKLAAPEEEIGNKRGSLSNHLRAVLA
jgi:hypothetical protein